MLASASASDRLQQAIRHCWHTQGIQRPLLAVSAGIDSMCLWHAVWAQGYPHAVAYLNHGLRAEAEADEQLISQLAQERKVPFHLHRVQVGRVKAGDSTQAVARRLRYAWLSELADKEGYDYILVAQHADDQAETILASLVRGKDWQVLKGIASQWGRVLRPWLAISRAEITTYAATHRLAYLEDSSNADTHYQRNYLRHTVIPQLKQLNPNLLDHLQQRLGHYQAQLDILQQQLEPMLQARLSGNSLALQHDETDALLIAYWLRSQLEAGPLAQVQGLLQGQKGGGINTPVGRFIRERDAICWQHTAPEQPAPCTLHGLSWQGVWNGLKISLIKTAAGPAPLRMGTQLALPLQLRCWQAGDRIQLLGGPVQKVSDILTNAKIPHAERARQWVLTDATGTLLYLSGQRVAEQAKVQANATQQYVLEVGQEGG
ncbi:MAG: tRNA lysidine(34) synthetase TilS [Sphingobacteriia bacterium]